MLLATTDSAAQPCLTAFGPVYGTPEGNEYGYSLAATLSNDAFYIGGVKDDSTLVVKMNTLGVVLWSRTFEIIPGTICHAASIFVDSDGMICMSGTAGDQGTGGNLFACRYDPDADAILWAREYVTAAHSMYGFSAIEKSSGGNYIISTVAQHNSISNGDAQLIEVQRSNGAIVSGFSKTYHLGGSDEFSDLVVDPSGIYAVGRFSDGFATGDMRNTLAKINPSNGDVSWMRMGHISNAVNARLYGYDAIIEGGQIYSGCFGDPSGTSLTNTKLYLQQTDLNGNLIWLNQYEIAGNNDWGFELINSDNGIVALVQRRAQREWVLYKVNYSGTVQWAKSYQFTNVNNTDSNWPSRSNLIQVGGYLVFTGWGNTSSAGGEIVVMITDLEGELVKPCVSYTTISLTATPVSNPLFYSVSPTVTPLMVDEFTEDTEPVATGIGPNEICTLADTVYAFIDASICDGDEYEGYSVPGTYVDYFTTPQGCDSVRTLQLSQYPLSDFTESITICLGESYEGYEEGGVYTELHVDMNGCDSVYTLILEVEPLTISPEVTICQGDSYAGYAEDGFYIDTIQGPPGECDTVRMLTLEVLPEIESYISATICEGESYEGYTQEGIYIDDFTNVDGCDSVRTLDLSVAEVEETLLMVTICEGQSYEGYSTSGIFYDDFISEAGCDSVRILELMVTSVIEVFIDVTICTGQDYEGYTTSGTYIDDFISQGGCDSTRTLDLIVTDELTSHLDVSICEGESYEGYSDTGTYDDSFISSNGCDSVRTLDLTVIASIANEISISICEGKSYEGYTEAGTYIDVLTAVSGCDSVRTLQLTVHPSVQTTFQVTICEGDTYMGYTTPGVYTDTFQTQRGCDSIRHLQLSVINCTQPCTNSPSKIYGVPGRGEHGQCLVPTPENDAVYLAANREDSTLLAKIDLNGNWIWSKMIDAIPNDHELPAGILVDADGMIAVSGTAGHPVSGGSLYAFRYDPVNHQLLWAREYSHSPNDFNFDIEEKGSGGNYLLANQATFFSQNFNDGNITEIDKNTGALIPDFQKSYHLSGTESIYELTYHQDYVYGVARYKDIGPSSQEMRHTLVKLDPANGQQLWVKMGHLPNTSSGRLYGTDMVIDNDHIISMYSGDPNGHTTTNTEVFIQQTDLNGNLIWVKRYDIPGNNSTGYELIKSGDGYVAYTTEVSTGEHFLFKIDQTGEVRWSKKFVFNSGADIYYGHRGNQMLVEAGNKLVMTGAIVNITGDADMFIIMTDLDGNVSSPCIENEPVIIKAVAVPNPVFYDVLPEERVPDTTSFVLQPLIFDRFILPLTECGMPDTIFTIAAMSICAGSEFNGYTEAGEYTEYYTSVDGCDSVHTLVLDVLPPLLTFINADLCEGQSLLGYDVTGIYADTFVTVNGCDSVRTLQLTLYPVLTTSLDISICEGQSFSGYTNAGMHVDSFVTGSGCDSVRILNLTVYPTQVTTIDTSICNGESFLGFSVTGLYVDSFINVNGCDSVRMVTLTVEPALVTSETISICAGQSYLGYAATGMYLDTFAAVNGCDSIHMLSLTVEPVMMEAIQQTICLGETIDGYGASGFYADTFQTTAGCDSVRQLQLTVQAITSQLDVSICDGEAFEQYTAAGTYVDTIFSAVGMCDTVRTLNLHVLNVVQTTIEGLICSGDAFEGYTQDGIYVDTFTSIAGCDSIRSLDLQLTPPVEQIVQTSICAIDNPFSFQAGTYVDTFETVGGCDSIRTLIIEGSNVYVPNVFTPNQDGINDAWTISPSVENSLDLAYVAVFDRFGNMAFETTQWPIEWKGDDVNGKPFQPGVFAYVFIYFCGNVKYAEHGNITLVR